MRTSECDIVIVGVGGQGVILISDVIGRAAVRAGKPVRGAETHGMAQRGGSVINHTRIGCRFSPMVASGRSGCAAGPGAGGSPALCLLPLARRA